MTEDFEIENFEDEELHRENFEDIVNAILDDIGQTAVTFKDFQEVLDEHFAYLKNDLEDIADGMEINSLFSTAGIIDGEEVEFLMTFEESPDEDSKTPYVVLENIQEYC